MVASGCRGCGSQWQLSRVLTCAVSLQAVPALTPRQLAILQHPGMPDSVSAAFAGSTTVVESKLTDPAAGPVRAA